MNRAALDALAESRAWRMGSLVWLMLAIQRVAWAAFSRSEYAVFVVLCSRRWGKTRFACLMCWQKALQHPGAIIRYACPTKAHGRQFVRPAMRWIERLAPAHLRPRFVTQDNTWIWPNGSVMHLGSCESDGDVDAQVGTECHLAVVDEAGKIRSELLRKLVRSVILPQFLTTRGRVCVTGTPPDSPEHYFRDLVTQAIERGTLVTHTIDDCKHVDDSAKAELLAELGGPNSTEAQRELWVKFVTESSRAIIPEYAVHKHIVAPDEWTVERPRHYDTYTVADTGFRDLTVVVFGYYHFALNALVIEDELALRYHSGGAVGRAVLEKERALWGDRPPLLRWADASPQVIADMREGSETRDPDTRLVTRPGCSFAPAEKQDSIAALNRLRTRVEKHRVLIHPRCVVVRSHMEYGIWNIGRTDFERTDSHHWDGVAAMKYAVRACRWGKNPAPIVEAHHPDHAFAAPHLLAQQKRVDQARRGQGDPFAAAFARRDR